MDKKIIVKEDSKLITVLAEQIQGKQVDPATAEEAAQIISELTSDLSPENCHQIAQVVGYTIGKLQEHALDFLNRVADIKTVAYGDKAMFNVKTEGIHAFYQAKGATTARSYVSERQISLGTESISARPAINSVDMKSGRVNMADLIREANDEITKMKIMKVEQVLHDAIDDFSSPFYASGTGIVQSTLDAQLAYFRRLGPVTILGDASAVQQLSMLVGMALNPVPALNDPMYLRSNETLNEFNANGYIGKYKGCDVLQLVNAYHQGTTNTILDPDWLYIIPGGMTGDARNLKVIEEGGIETFEARDIDDLTYEIRLDTNFGCGFINNKLPNIGAYQIL